MGVSVSEMLQHAEGVTEAPGGAWGGARGRDSCAAFSWKPGVGPQSSSSRPLLPQFGLLLDPASGGHREQHSWSGDPAQGVCASHPASHGTRKALDWHVGENCPAPVAPGKVGRGPSQGACPPAASAKAASQTQL